MNRKTRRKLLLLAAGVLLVLVLKISLPVLDALQNDTSNAGSAVESAQAVNQSPDETKQALTESSAVWGLGDHVSSYVSNSVNYNWYIDQRDTGTFYGDNCGPTSIIMAGLWRDEAFSYTVEEARSVFRSEGGWWYPDDISDALEYYEIPYHTVILEDASTIKSHLDIGQILIINNNMRFINEETDETSHLGRFYDRVEGHFLIVKGYAVVDGILYFETYDPNSMHKTYEDGAPKGLNRYYEADNLVESALAWYDTIWVINP
jgi:hypothetical protein